MADPDRVRPLREVGKVLPERVFERQQSLVLGHQHRRHRELLGHRRHPEDGIGGERNPVVQVRHPVRAAERELPVPEGAGGAAGRVFPVPFGEDRVEVRRGRLGYGGAGDCQRKGEQTEDQPPLACRGHGASRQPLAGGAGLKTGAPGAPPLFRSPMPGPESAWGTTVLPPSARRRRPG